MTHIFEGDFGSVGDVISNFNLDTAQAEVLRAADRVYAVYGHEDYDGWAFVLYRTQGRWYEVHGSHCSCYGLEGQWEPEEAVLQAVARYDCDTASWKAFITQALAEEANG